jgi:DNA helicase-2/ATP-dependent DNA helicase PcrA
MLSKTFNTSKANLNKKQREAVDTIEGPMLVIAGPGTGKTQLLSIRVGNILNQTDVDPSNILCLTFTDAAREEMYDRLNVLIGPSSSNVNIYTYHSLGSELIKSYPEYFENIINSNLVEEVNKINIIRKIQSGLSYKNKYKQ